jgi:hypothetical protein
VILLVLLPDFLSFSCCVCCVAEDAGGVCKRVALGGHQHSVGGHQELRELLSISALLIARQNFPFVLFLFLAWR